MDEAEDSDVGEPYASFPQASDNKRVLLFAQVNASCRRQEAHEASWCAAQSLEWLLIVDFLFQRMTMDSC